jgi:NAD(P) transhydrogenase
LREFYGASYTVKQNITIQDLLSRTNRVIHNELDLTRHQLMRNDVELLTAETSFAGPDTFALDYVNGSASRTVKAHKIVIAAGTETTRDPHVPFDGNRIFTATTFFIAIGYPERWL